MDETNPAYLNVEEQTIICKRTLEMLEGKNEWDDGPKKKTNVQKVFFI